MNTISNEAEAAERREVLLQIARHIGRERIGQAPHAAERIERIARLAVMPRLRARTEREG